MVLSFGLKRPLCNMSGAAQIAYIAFNIVVDRIGTRDLVQESLAYRVFSSKILMGNVEVEKR
jgi:hypothetical protein